ncbi:MAG: WecB/TagA/CpsF family glycosyltransferase [Fibrobacterales bacterium]
MNILQVVKNQEKWDHEFKGKIITFINPYSYQQIRTGKYLQSFSHILCDSFYLAKFFNLFSISKESRYSFDMTSLAPKVFSWCESEHKSVYFIGSTQENISQYIETFSKSYPTVTIAGYRHGFFTSTKEREEYLTAIKELNPDVVIVGMGAPLQEMFLSDLVSTGWSGTGFTCGGFIHQSTESIQYYPKWVDSLQVRWLYRIYDEPKLFTRYAFDYPKFLLFFALDFINVSLKSK